MAFPTHFKSCSSPGLMHTDILSHSSAESGPCVTDENVGSQGPQTQFPGLAQAEKSYVFLVGFREGN